MEKLLTPKCHICQETDFRALYCDEVYKAKAPKSQKTILEVIRHISRVLKVTFTVPARARVCTVCYKELVRYDCYVVELLDVQKRLSEKINARVKGIKLKPAVKVAVEKDLDSERQFEANNDVDNDDEDNGEIETVDETDDNITESEDDMFVDPELNTSSVCVQQEEIETESILDTYPCPVCNLKLKNQRALEYHLKNDHKNRVTCDVCGIQVRDDEYLVLHMNTHNGKTENECSFCGKHFARRVNVIRHMQVHFNKSKHQCERCGMSFSQTTTFYNHRLRHEAEDNPLICPVCSQTFRTIRTYKGHMITHKEDRPRYNCEHCGKVFVDKYTLKMHVRTNHSQDAEESKTQNAQKKTKPSPNEESDHVIFTCVICQHIFVRQDLFADHMQNVHDVIMDP